MQGTKHLINCNCILPHLKNRANPVFHSFPVFSTIGEDGEVIEKVAHCNHCGAIHKVFDICKSEILPKDSSAAVITEKDISLLIPTELSSILSTYQCDVSSWEHAHFIYTNAIWGDGIILTRSYEDGISSGKRLIISGHNQFKIEPFTFNEAV